jgi:hypothetical protein
MKLDPVLTFLHDVSDNHHYYNVLNQYEQIKDYRYSIRMLFPFVITAEGSFDSIETIEAWCSDYFGPRHGNSTKLSKSANNIAELIRLYNLAEHPMQDDVDSDFYFDYTQGSWTSFWILRAAADYFFCDFCFKEVENAVFFKLTFLS